MNLAQLNRPDLFIERAFIGGEWQSARQGRTLGVDNPATGEILGTIPDCDETDTRAAIDAAAGAFPDWRARTAGERSALLERWHALIL